MITFEITGGPYGDCTSNYKVIIHNKPLTFKNFVDEVLQRNNEWGEIRLGKSWIDCIGATKSIEYSKGQILKDDLLAEYSDCEVLEIKANGGWSKMDYYVSLKVN